jgi:hypothetical protein
LRLSLRVVLIALVALVAAGAIYNALPGASNHETASNFTDGWCSDEGVTLHVEAQGPTSTRCAKEFSGTGWDIFAATSTKVQGTAQYPTGFVCRIAELPVAQDCKDMPRFDEGSWAYFYAEPGDTDWHFSPVGSATRKPSCGGVEAWVFVDGGATSTTPAQAPRTFVCK